MRNQFPGTCYRCGEEVAAGAGHFEKTPFTRFWRVQHAECAIKFRGTDVGKDGETERREAWRKRKLERDASGTGKRAQRARQELARLHVEAMRKEKRL